jgi:hypothetical protein
MKQGHTDRLIQRGYDLVRVSAHPAPAPQCHPYEGKILSLTGRTENGRHEVENARTGRPMTVTVMASMAEAEAKGLHHPNCKHRHALMVPGATVPEPPPYDPQAYKDEQKLRYLERQVRQAKREQAAAITPAAKKDANARVRARQAAIRDHVDKTGVARRTHREQLRDGKAGKANDAGTFERVDPPKPAPAPAAAKPAGPYDDIDNLDDIAKAADKAIADGDFDALDHLEAREAVIRSEQAAREARNAAARDKRAAAAEAKRAAQDAEHDRLLAEGMGWEEATEKAFGISVEKQRRDNAISSLRASGHTGAGFDEITRDAYKRVAYDEWLAAENATNGFMLNRAHEHLDIDTRDLWRINEDTARKYASEELLGYWDEHGRTTLDGYRQGWLNGEQGHNRGGDWLQ